MKKIKVPIYELSKRIRTEKPVVHHLTNWVTIYDCANTVKVIGGSPVMAHAREEVQDMVRLASSLVLNIGTLTVDFVESMKLAAMGANIKGIPVILDVCGAGATQLRDQKCFELLDKVKINIIKGNLSEVARIAGKNVRTKGVDATHIDVDIMELASSLAQKRNCTVVVTGKDDIITDARKGYVVKNGHPMMANIVGTGCMAGSIIGTFAAVEPDLALSSAAALSLFGIAGELSAKSGAGPGTFKEKLFNHLYSLDRKTIDKMQKVYR